MNGTLLFGIGISTGQSHATFVHVSKCVGSVENMPSGHSILLHASSKLFNGNLCNTFSRQRAGYHLVSYKAKPHLGFVWLQRQK
jgi:hypothetical protein